MTSIKQNWTLILTRHRNTFLLLISFVSLATAYFVVTPPNAGPEEINHAQASWYLVENPSELFSKSSQITYTFPSELTISNAGGYLKNLACFSQQMSIPSSCQQLEVGKKVELTTPMLNRGNFYYLLIGLGEKLSLSSNVFQSGKIISFLLCLIIVALAILRLGNNLGSYAIYGPFLALTGTVVFFFSVINPNSFEIAAAFYFASSLLISTTEKIPKIGSDFHLYVSAFLLAISRSFGGVWIISLLGLSLLLFKTVPRLKPLLFIASFGIVINQLTGNRTYPLGEWNPPWNFYLEESVRVFNGSGDWVTSLFGTLSWSEIRLPLILVFMLLLSYFFLFLSATQSLANQRIVLFGIFVGLYLIPFSLSVVFAKNWPGWWQGRNGLPFFVGTLILLLGKEKKLNLKYPAVLIFLSNVYLLLLTFARFNWGLYGTNTPIIANGWSFDAGTTIAFICCLTLYVFSTALFLRQMQKVTVTREYFSD